MKLTLVMLEAMEMALNEVLGGEGFQGVSENENKRLLKAAHKAADWCAEQIKNGAGKPLEIDLVEQDWNKPHWLSKDKK